MHKRYKTPEEKFEHRRNLSRSEELAMFNKKYSPEVTSDVIHSVSEQRRDRLQWEVEQGLYREQGSIPSSLPNNYPTMYQEPDFTRSTQAGVVATNGRGMYKYAQSVFSGSTGAGVGLGSGSGWQGSNNTARQVPEVYSPLWLNSNLNLPRDRATINAWSRSFFALNPIVHNSISLHSTYPISKLSIKSKNRKVEKFFSQMIEEIDLMNICVQVAQEFWILGEAFIYAEIDESKAKWTRLLIQNPDYITVSRNVIAGEPIISLRPDENLRRIVNSQKPEDIDQKRQLDPAIIEYVKRNQNIPLNNVFVSHLARRISPYEVRGTGLLVSCFRDLMLFDKLRESKYVQSDNMVNPLTLVKIGNGEFRPTPVDLEAWRNVFEECHDEETEVLTDQGFMKFQDAIEVSDVLEATSGTVFKTISRPKSGVKIACFNPDTDKLEYHEPSESHVYDYNGEMYHFHNDKMDIKVTPNHKMWVQRKRFNGTGKQRTSHWGEWEKVRAKDMKFFDRRFRSKIEWDGDDSPEFITVTGKEVPVELYLEYLGYVISEGCLYTDGRHQHTVGLTQTIVRKYGEDNSEKYEKMSSCMKEFCQCIEKSYSDRVVGRADCGQEVVWDGVVAGWKLFKHFVNEVSSEGRYKSKDKRIPRWVLNLSPRLLRILLDALVLGDGSTQSDSGKFYYTASKQLADDVYEAVYKVGFVPTTFERDGMFVIQWSETSIGEFPLVNKYSTDPRTKQKTEIVSKTNYDGKVWCFTVPTGLFVTRRNGKITVQGNSQYDKDFKIFTHDAVNVERVGWGQGIYDISGDITQIIKEIYIGLMVPSVIMDGSDTTYGNGSVALDVLRQRYMQFRNMISMWLKRKIFAPISKLNEFYEYIDGEKTLIVPEIDWNHMSLFDMNDYINSLSQLVQGQGVDKKVSLQTLYRSLGLEYEEEQRKLRYEDIQDAIRVKEQASLVRYSLSELRALGPDDEIQEIAEPPVPGESPYVDVPGQQLGAPGLGGPPGGGLGLPPPPGGGGLPPPGGGGGPKPLGPGGGKPPGGAPPPPL